MTGVKSQTSVSSPHDYESARSVKIFEFGRSTVVSSSGDSNKVSQEGSATEEKATGKKPQTTVSSPYDFQTTQNAQRKTFEFKRDALIKSDGGLTNVAQGKLCLAKTSVSQSSTTTQKSDISDAKLLSEDKASFSTTAATTTPKSVTPNTTNESPLEAADLATSTKSAGSHESKSTNDPNETEGKSTMDSSGRKVFRPVSRRSAQTSIDPAHTAQGYFTPKKAPSSTHITAASPSTTTSRAQSTSTSKAAVPQTATPNATPTNPFYATNMTLPVAAGNIIAYFREASQWLTFWRDTLSTPEFADLLRAKWDPKLKQITWHFACTVEFLEMGREGWKLTRLPEEFFKDALGLVEGVEGLIREMEERKRCQGVLEGVKGNVERVGRLLVGIRQARWEEGRARWEADLKAKRESG